MRADDDDAGGVGNKDSGEAGVEERRKMRADDDDAGEGGIEDSGGAGVEERRKR